MKTYSVLYAEDVPPAAGLGGTVKNVLRKYEAVNIDSDG
jgi:hypothetical protein